MSTFRDGQSENFKGQLPVSKQGLEAWLGGSHYYS